MFKWIKSGIGIKRWICLSVIGIVCLSFAFILMFRNVSLIWRLIAIVFATIGSLFVVFSAQKLVKVSLISANPVSKKQKCDENKFANLVYDRRYLMKDPKIVAIGGGTGLSTMLRGLKAYTSNITAVVTMADDGGGSGVLREDLRMLPPGDIRNCILALADTEPIMEKLLQYRFEDGMLKGQCFGNLFLAAMNGISGNFEEAVQKMSDVLAVTGRVLPVSLYSLKLCAELENGLIIHGESKITRFLCQNSGRIKRVFLLPREAEPLQEVLDAIMDADIIVLGPGSLYTSIIPNLLVNGVTSAIRKSPALKAYVCNIMTQPGETDKYTAYDHLKAIERHSYKGIIDKCIINDSKIPEKLKDKYRSENSEIVQNDIDKILKEGIKVITGDYLKITNGLVRHDSEKLARTIIELTGSKCKKNAKRTASLYYIK